MSSLVPLVVGAAAATVASLSAVALLLLRLDDLCPGERVALAFTCCALILSLMEAASKGWGWGPALVLVGLAAVIWTGPARRHLLKSDEDRS